MLFFKSIQSVLTVILMIGLGYILQKNNWFSEGFAKCVSALVVKIALPAAIFMSILKHLTRGSLIQLSGSLLYPIVTVILSYVIAYIVMKIMKIRPGRRGIFLNAVANANTIFIGMPLNMALFGNVAIPFFLVCYVSNTISTWAFGIFLIANDSTDETSKKNVFNWKKVLSPPLVGFLIGVVFLLLNIKVPAFIGSALEGVGGIVTPLSLIYIGIILCNAGIKNMKFERDTVVALIGRFILCPVLMIGLIMIGSTYFGHAMPTLMKQTFIVQSATPMLAVLPMLAAEYNGDVEYATNLVTSSTILFVIVTPILMQITQFIH